MGSKDFSLANMNNAKADLGLAVSNTNQWQNSNMAAGAGANANSRADMMTFVGSDTLAELVWSPRKGLSIKFADKKPCFMWEGGPSDIAGTQKQKGAGHLSDRLLEVASGFNGLGSNIKSHVKTEVMTQCGPQEHLEKGIVKIEKDDCFSDPFPEISQRAILENKKYFYCQENDEKHEVESHGSVESCKSANGKRRLDSEQLFLGSKRNKKQNDGNFINWISNMLKDLKNHEINQSVCDINRSFESRKMGFQSGSRSLSLPDVKAHETMTNVNRCSRSSLDLLKIKEKEAKHISLYERVSKEAPKGLFDTIRRLRLSRNDILKWTESRLPFAKLDGFFLRLRVAKWEEGAGGSRYYVACIRGLQGENPGEGLKLPICVKVEGVECFVESQYVSNCDFLEDELVAWLQKTSRNGGTPFVKDLILKLSERRKLGI